MRSARTLLTRTLFCVALATAGALAVAQEGTAITERAPAPPPPSVEPVARNAGSQALSYLSVAGNSMRPRSSVAYTTGSPGCTYFPGATDFLTANLRLPDGAVMKSLRLEFIDSNPAGTVRGVIVKYSMNGGGFTELGLVQSVDGGTVADGAAIEDIVDNASFAYTFHADAATGATNQICGLRVAYYPPPEGRFVPIAPCRLVDTRGGAPVAGGKFAAGETRTYVISSIAAACNTVPGPTLSSGPGTPPIHGIRAYALNLTVTAPDGPGFLSAYPSGPVPVPLTSTLNFAAGQTIANAVNVPARIDGGIDVVAGASGAHVVIDVVGYFF